MIIAVLDAPSSSSLSPVLSSFGVDESTLSTDTSRPAADKESSRFLSSDLDTDDDKCAADEMESSVSTLSDTATSNATLHVYVVARWRLGWSCCWRVAAERRRRRRVVEAVYVTAKLYMFDKSTEITLAIVVLRMVLSASVGAALALMPSSTDTRTVSPAVGLALGPAVGEGTVGAAAPVGFLVGLPEGAGIGTFEGTGVVEGTDVGLSVGLRVGESVGLRVGESVGLRVGASVGF